MQPPPDDVDAGRGTAGWRLRVAGRGEVVVTVTVQPVSDGVAADRERPSELARGRALRELPAWRSALPTVVSLDPRLSTAVDQALTDLAALRIVDRAHPERPVVAAGAPWFMTLFGRDSLLTAWMTLPFDGSLARGVLASLAELQGVERRPGLRGAARPHHARAAAARRQRRRSPPAAATTARSTPLRSSSASPPRRGGGGRSTRTRSARLAPAVGRAVDWIIGPGDSDGDGFVDYRRRDPRGLANQGWKDSWDGITRSDGTLPTAPLALVEVQGYAYAALRGAADPGRASSTSVTTPPTSAAAPRRSRTASTRSSGTGVAGSSSASTPTAGPSTRSPRTPGTRCGPASPTTTRRAGTSNGWPTPTSGPAGGCAPWPRSMAAYDPLSYHNGSVWPHDTALCVAGAARYGHWDVVDLLVDGALEATRHFDGRPPELFAGLSRDDVAMPVPYPSSCSPQAWASASVLLLVRAMLGLEPTADRSGVELVRGDLSGVPDLVARGP